MLVYRGDHQDSFKIDNFNSSRYNINVLFFATDVKLARLYAIHQAKKRGNYNGGYVYNAELPDNISLIDFGGAVSYGRELKDLVLKHQKTGASAIHIYNILDYPSQNLVIPNSSDVIAVFNFSLIKNLQLIESGVK